VDGCSVLCQTFSSFDKMCVQFLLVQCFAQQSRLHYQIIKVDNLRNGDCECCKHLYAFVSKLGLMKTIMVSIFRNITIFTQISF